MKAQAEKLPAVLLPIGYTSISTFSKVEILDTYVQKRITFSNETWLHSRCQLMEDIYAASKDCPFLIHAQDPPHASANGKEYVVGLEPVGSQLGLVRMLAKILSKHSDRRSKLHAS